MFLYIPVGVYSQDPGSMALNFCRRIEAVVFQDLHNSPMRLLSKAQVTESTDV
jgi:hypothetical protein